MPGPGSKRMKPKGFEAAASTTSQTSTSSRSQSIASSFTSAMLTERKMFSSSFVSSAASGVADLDDLVADQLVELDRARGGFLVEAADDLRGGADRVVGAARVDPLGGEGEVEVTARGQPGLLQDRPEPLTRRARIGGRLEHDQLALLHHRRQRGGGVDHVAQVRLAGVGQRCRDADDHRVARAQIREAAGRGQAAVERGEPLRGDVLDVAPVLGEGIDLARIGIEADDLVALLGEGDRKRKPHIPQPHDSYLHARKCRDAATCRWISSCPVLSRPARHAAADDVVDVEPAGRRGRDLPEAGAVDGGQVPDHRRRVHPEHLLQRVDVVGLDADRDRPALARHLAGRPVGALVGPVGDRGVHARRGGASRARAPSPRSRSPG